MAHVVVVGAGVAGLAAARALVAGGVAVTVVEKSRGLGGRAATRRRDGWRYDHGAQVLTLDGPGGDLLRDVLGEALVRVGPVWPVGDDGVARPADARDEGRWTVAGGISAVGRALALAGLDVRLQTHVARVRPDGARWRVETDGGTLGADAVLVTAPAPQAAALVAGDALADALAAVPYRSQFAVVWAFDGPAPRPEPYALVHVGEASDVAWLAAESDKPGRAPAGATLLVAQMTDAWTRARYDAPRETVVAEATAAVEAWLGERLPAPAVTDTQRWRYSLPDAAVDARARAAAEARGLFVAGDGCVGRGRVHLAAADGWAAGERIRRAVGR